MMLPWMDRVPPDARLAALRGARAVAEFDAQGTLLSGNEAFFALMGHPAAGAVGRHHAQFVPPAEREGEAYRGFWASLRGGAPQAGVFRRLAADGREVWIAGAYAPVRGRNGRVVRVLKTACDVTGVLDGAQGAVARMAAIGRSSAIIEFTPVGTVLSANANFLAAMGYAAEEVVGRHHAMFMPPGEAQGEDYAAFWRRLARGESFSAEWRRVAKGGREIWIQASYNPVLDAAGRVSSVVKVASDITAMVQRRQAREALGRDVARVLEVVGGTVAATDRSAAAALGDSASAADSVGAVAAAAEEMAASVGEISRRLAEASQASAAAAGRVAGAGGLIAAMEEAAERIGAAVRLIGEIAGQTRLLALNATIEAARAGDAGRGFGVVAGEVKALSAQTARATEEVAAMVGQVRGAVGAAAGALGGIGAAVGSLDGITGAIAAAVEEQSAVTREMSQRLNDASGAVGGVARGLEGVAGGAAEARRATEELAGLYRALG